MVPPVQTFDYMNRFSCIGPACEDTCCSAWKVNLYRKDYDKIKTLLERDPSKKHYRPCLKRNPPGERIEENYGFLDFGSDGHCGMLDQGWCVLHRDHGETLLPTVCATFPRLIYERAQTWEVHGRLSCPEVARLCLLSEQRPQLNDGGQEQLPQLYETNPWPREGGGFYKRHLPAVTDAIRALMLTPGLNLASRNYLVLYLSRLLEPFFHEGIQEDPAAKLQRAIERVQNPSFQARVPSELAASRLDSEPLFNLVLGIANARLGADHFARYNAMRELVMRSYGGPGTLLAREGVIGNDTPPAALWKAFLGRRALVLGHFGERVDRYFQNLSINFWWQALFHGDPNPLVPARRFLLTWSLLRFFFLSHPQVLAAAQNKQTEEEAGPLLDAAIVEVVQVFMKQIDANATMLQSLLASMDTLGFQTLAEQASLLAL